MKPKVPCTPKSRICSLLGGDTFTLECEYGGIVISLATATCSGALQCLPEILFHIMEMGLRDREGVTSQVCNFHDKFACHSVFVA